MHAIEPLLLLVCLVGVGWLAYTLQELRRRLDLGEARRLDLERRLQRLERNPSDPATPSPGPVSSPSPTESARPLAAPAPAPAPALPPLLAREPATLPAIPPTPPPTSAGTPSDRPDPSNAVPPTTPSVDWERFLGVRLFAWLGGLALFLAVAYFVKYSFDHDLVPPSARVLIGLFVGAGLLVGGVFLRRREYAVTSQTLCATGVVVLYAALFAGHSLYHLAWLPQSLTFALMSAVTAAAFVLAVRMPAQVVAILGMLGGFLTPVLLSSGEDRAVALFGYIGLLDAGLLAVAVRRRWHYLAPLGALGTALLQIGWVARFFAPEKVGFAWIVFAGFGLLFVAGLALARRLREDHDLLAVAAAIAAFTTLGMAGWLLSQSTFADRPGTVFAFVLAADLCLLAVAWWRDRLAALQGVAGLIAFAYLMGWMATGLERAQLGWALGLTVGFAVLHAAFPLALRQWKPDSGGTAWAQVFPPIAVAVLFVPLMKLESPSFALWPAILLLQLLALALAFWVSGLLGALAAVLLGGVATALWIGRLPTEVGELGGTLLVVVGFAALFAGAGSWLARRHPPTPGPETLAGEFDPFLDRGPDAVRRQIPVVGTLLPFLLLAQLVAHVSLPDPSAVFGVLGLVLLLLLALSAWLKNGVLPLAGLVGLALVEHVWLVDENRTATGPLAAIAWALVFLAILAWFPFPGFAGRRVGHLRWPWIASALAGLPQFHFVYRIIEHHWPNEVMGLVPLAFALPPACALVWCRKHVPPDHPRRLERLAWFGGMTLFFVTVAIPVQFDRQWLTLGLALEGAALLHLFRRVPHPGLARLGIGLLAAAFVRLVLNPGVLDYAVRGPTPFWNGWLYTYGLASIATFLGAFRAPAGRDPWLGLSPRALLVSLGTILVFALLNLQIADFFTPVGERVRFEFSGHFGRDMTYTIAWSLFALLLVSLGLTRRLPACRRAGLGLLAVATAKLFLHDLARLDQLYRVGALVGVALVALAASVLYQRFVARETPAPDSGRQM